MCSAVCSPAGWDSVVPYQRVGFMVLKMSQCSLRGRSKGPIRQVLCPHFIDEETETREHNALPTLPQRASGEAGI